MLTKCGELSGECEVDALGQFVELILSSSSDTLARISHLLGSGALSEQHQAECDGSSSSESVAICAQPTHALSRAPIKLSKTSCVVSPTSVARVWPRTLTQLRVARSARDDAIRSASSYASMAATQTQPKTPRGDTHRHKQDTNIKVYKFCQHFFVCLPTSTHKEPPQASCHPR